MSKHDVGAARGHALTPRRALQCHTFDFAKHHGFTPQERALLEAKTAKMQLILIDSTRAQAMVEPWRPNWHYMPYKTNIHYVPQRSNYPAAMADGQCTYGSFDQPLTRVRARLAIACARYAGDVRASKHARA